MFIDGLTGTSYSSIPDTGVYQPLIILSCKCSVGHDLSLSCRFSVTHPVPYCVFPLREPPEEYIEVQRTFDEFLAYAGGQLLYWIDETGHVCITSSSIMIVADNVVFSPKHLY